MLKDAPNPEPIIVEARENASVLASYDLSEMILHSSILAGHARRISLTRYAPDLAPGFDQWAGTVEALRLQTSATGIWVPATDNGLEMSRNSSKGIQINTCAGTSDVGTAGAGQPDVVNPKGNASAFEIQRNELELALGNGEGIRKMLTWWLLYFLGKNEDGVSVIRAELSLPEMMSKGHVYRWHKRVLLADILLSPIPISISKDGPDDIDFPITRKTA